MESRRGNHSNENGLSRLGRRLLDVVVGLIVGIILLVIEYRTGFFVGTYGVTRRLGPTLFAVACVLLVVSAEYTFVVWIRSKWYTRERFALAALVLIASLTLAFLTSLVTSFLPWHLLYVISSALSGQAIVLPEPSWAEYILFAALYFLSGRAIFRLYSRWDGPKSVDQYRREQREKSVRLITLAVEGYSEFIRILNRRPARELYVEPPLRDSVGTLETVTSSLAWKDQAKELIRLSSSTYDFDDPEGWHDNPGCWIGTNGKTGDLICLYPAFSATTDEQLDNLIQYADRIAAQKSTRLFELIVAVQDDTVPEVTEWNGRSIRFETESSLLDKLVDFRDYEREIRRRLISSLPDSELSIEDVYVPSRCKHAKTGTVHDNVEAYLREWLEESGQRQIALLGEYGQGKSTAARMLTHRILSESEELPPRIPILIELRGRSPGSQARLGLLGDWASQYNIGAQALERLLDAGRLLIIFEGFDEMAMVADIEMRLAHFRTLGSFCYPRAKILITGRPNFFLDDEEMRAALGVSEPRPNEPYCDVLRLEPFSLSQIKASLRARKPSTRDQICSLASENKRFRDLIARPSLLYIVSELWEKERLSENVDRLNSAYIMDLFIRKSYLRQGLKVQDEASRYAFLNTPERKYFMRGIATYMAARHLPNQILGEQLNDAIEMLLDAIPDAVSSAPSAISGENRRYLKLRVAEAEQGLEQVKVDVRTCGILVDDPTAPGSFGFGHKSFMEYLFASVLAEYINEDDPLQRARAILRATNAGIEDILNLPVSIGFLAELVDSSSANGYTRDGQPVERMHQDAAERAFVARLFRAVSEMSRLRATIERLSLFSRAWTASGMHLPLFTRLLVFLCHPRFVLGFAMLSYVFARVFELVEPIGNESFAEKALWLFAALVLAVSSNRIFSAREPREHDSMVAGRYGLWNYICVEVDIRNRVLHRFAGTWLLPWAKNQPFDYFLARPAPDEHNGQPDEIQ